MSAFIYVYCLSQYTCNSSSAKSMLKRGRNSFVSAQKKGWDTKAEVGQNSKPEEPSDSQKSAAIPASRKIQ